MSLIWAVMCVIQQQACMRAVIEDKASENNCDKICCS